VYGDCGIVVVGAFDACVVGIGVVVFAADSIAVDIGGVAVAVGVYAGIVCALCC